MAGPDILDSGPATPRRRHPRWLPVAGGVLAAGVAVFLAARAAPEGEPAPAPLPTVASTPGPPLPAVIAAVAVGSRSAYALVFRCDHNAVQACEYRLFQRSLSGGGWTTADLRFETRSTRGVIPELLVDQDDRAVVLGPGQSWAWLGTETATGIRYGRSTLRLGTPVDALPPGAPLLAGSCYRCDGRLVTLDAAAGTLRPLATQPPLGTGPVRSWDSLGEVIWVISGDGERSASAVSRDRGRSWRTVPLSGTASDGLQAVVAQDGGAHLIGTRFDEQGNSRLAGIWRVPAGGGSWRQLRPGTAPTSVRSVVGGARDLLVVDLGGTTWRLGTGGAFDRLRDPGPVRPAWIHTGPGRLLVAVPRGDLPDPFILTSADEGETWNLEKLP